MLLRIRTDTCQWEHVWANLSYKRAEEFKNRDIPAGFWLREGNAFWFRIAGETEFEISLEDHGGEGQGLIWTIVEDSNAEPPDVIYDHELRTEY